MSLGTAETHRYVAMISEPLSRDLWQGVLAWRLWTMLAWNDIRQRYRRSLIGPMWMTLSMAVFVALLTVIYSRIFKVDIAFFMPYVAVGLIVWTFISASANESCSALLESERIIRQVKIPYSAFVMRVVWRNVIVLMHTIVLYVPLAIIFSINIQLTTLLVVPGLILVFLNVIVIGVILAVINTRYRDVQQIVVTTLQIFMFATPIMWPVSTIGEDTWIANFNPAFHLVEIVRGPLIGQTPAPISWVAAVGIVLVGALVAMLLLRHASKRLVYWL